MKRKKVAVIGFGQFGKFIAPHLEKHLIVVPFVRDSNPLLLQDCEFIIFAVSFGGLETVIKKVKKSISKNALILDVTSVKQKPLQLLSKHFPYNQILGTHPVFGPQSGKNGIGGLPIVLCNVSFSKANYTKAKKFFSDTLKLHVIEQTPKEHDYQMAQVQALTHFIGRALVHLKIKSYVTNTKSYAQLLELRSLLEFDSLELFKTIQNTNPEAKKVRAFSKRITSFRKRTGRLETSK